METTKTIFIILSTRIFNDIILSTRNFNDDATHVEGASLDRVTADEIAKKCNEKFAHADETEEVACNRFAWVTETQLT